MPGRALLVALVLLAAAPAPAIATFPGANGKIAYSRVPPGAGAGVSDDIYTIDWEGGEPARLTTDTAADLLPAWSPDGRRLAWMRSSSGQPSELWVMNADGSEKRKLPADGISGGQPTWSADGTEIIYFTSAEVRAVKVDAAGTRQVLAGQYSFPSASPDGQYLAFSFVPPEGGGGPHIYVTGANGSNPHRVSTTNLGLWPDWAPDSSRLLFFGLGPGAGKFYTVKPDGSDEQDLPLPDGHDPTWSPDGEWVAFRGAGGLTVARKNGSDSRVLVANEGSSPSWQPLTAPIVFIHGFGASHIECEVGGIAKELWTDLPAIALDGSLLNMRLADDGVSNLGASACGAVAEVRGDLVERPLGVDINGSTIDFLKTIAPTSHYLHAWDWRRSPALALDGLDVAVERARCGGTLPEGESACAEPVAEKVVLMAHSMGGLVTQLYLADAGRAAKVARALTVGTPYWGSPKSIFPLAAGIESPGASELDSVLNNNDFQLLARNLTGLYFLYPSANYGSWLSVVNLGGDLAGDALLEYVQGTLGGNASLLAQALDSHASEIDGFTTNGVDYEVLAGRGLPTVQRVVLDPGNSEVAIAWGDGDSTVPLRSALQGPAGTQDPLGEDVGLHYACNISHVPLPGHPAVTKRIEDFLLAGEPIEGEPGPCSAPAGYQVFLDVEIASARALPRAGDPLSLADAELKGLLQVMDFGHRTLLVTDDDIPVDVALEAGRFTLRISRIDGETLGPEQVYGPYEGRVVLRTGGGALAVDAPIPPRPAEPTTTVAPPTAAPVISGLRVKPALVRPARRGSSILRRRQRGRGARVTYRLTAPARVSFRVQRRVGRRWRTLRGSFAHHGRLGANGFHFSARVRKRALARGRYRLVARPAGGSNVARAGFRARR